MGNIWRQEAQQHPAEDLSVGSKSGQSALAWWLGHEGGREILVEQACLVVFLACVAEDVLLPLKHEAIGAQVCRRQLSHAVALGSFDLHCGRRYDDLGNLVLNREDLIE